MIHITTEQAFYKVIDELSRAEYFGIDTEGTGLDPHTNRLLLVSLYVNNNVYVIDFTKLSLDLVEEFKPILENESILKVGHNLMYEWKVFYHSARICMEGMHDTMVMDRAIYAGLFHDHDLKSIVKKYLNIEISKDIRETFIDYDINTSPPFTQEQLEYSAMDAVYPVQIYHLQRAKITQLGLDRIYNLEMGIIAPNAIAEYTGVDCDQEMLQGMQPAFEMFIREAERAFQRILIEHGAADRILYTSRGFACVNSRSGKQVLTAFNRIGIDLETLEAKKVQRWDLNNTKKNKKRSKKELEEFELDFHKYVDNSEVAGALDLYLKLDHKVLRAHAFLVGARKLLSTYIIGLQEKVNPITGRIHPGFNTYGAEATGRVSSTNPNLQNIPKDDKLKALGLGLHSIRKCFRSGKNRTFIIADYAGIELVILAVNSGDKKLLHAILEGDIHTTVAQEVLKYKDINSKNKKEYPHKAWRDGSKKLSYSIAYGTTGRNISESLNIELAQLGVKYTPKDGDQLIEDWFNLYPDTKAYLLSNARKAQMDGYVVDAWGRRRHWDRSTFIDKWKKLAAGREGMNMPIQGTSATMTKLAMLKLWKRLDRKKARMVINVHDELVIESIDNYVETASQIIKECMQEAIAETLPSIAHLVGKYESTSVSPNTSKRYDK